MKEVKIDYTISEALTQFMRGMPNPMAHKDIVEFAQFVRNATISECNRKAVGTIENIDDGFSLGPTMRAAVSIPGVKSDTIEVFANIKV